MHGDGEGGFVRGEHLFGVAGEEGVIGGSGGDECGGCVESSFQEQCAHNMMLWGKDVVVGKLRMNRLKKFGRHGSGSSEDDAAKGFGTEMEDPNWSEREPRKFSELVTIKFSISVGLRFYRA